MTTTSAIMQIRIRKPTTMPIISAILRALVLGLVGGFPVGKTAVDDRDVILVLEVERVGEDGAEVVLLDDGDGDCDDGEGDIISTAVDVVDGATTDKEKIKHSIFMPKK